MTDIIKSALDVIGGGPLLFIVAALMGIASLVGWVLGIRKSRLEIENLRTQITTAVGEMLLNLQQARKQYGDEATRCGKLARKLSELIQQQAATTDLHGAREDFAECLTNDVITAYLRECEWRRIDLDISTAGPDSYESLLRDATNEIRRFRRWLDIINHPKFLRVLNKEPLILQYRTMGPFIRVVEQFPVAIRNEQMRMATRIVDELLAPFTPSS